MKTGRARKRAFLGALLVAASLLPTLSVAQRAFADGDDEEEAEGPPSRAGAGGKHTERRAAVLRAMTTNETVLINVTDREMPASPDVLNLDRSRALLANVGTDIALGEALLASDDAERALTAYRRALARNPGSARAHAGVAEAQRALGHLDEAEQAATVARNLLPGDARVRALLDRIREARMDAP